MAKRRRPLRKKRSSSRSKDSASAALVISQRLLQGGPECLEENFIRLMLDSGQLQQEPEFADFYFDLEQTLTAATKQFARFRRPLIKAAKAKDLDAFDTIYDDYCMAVIDDLATPDFRQQLKRNLDRCIKRLRRSDNVELFESATFISVLLSPEEIKEDKMSLGVYGLVTMIYEASFDQAMFELPHARDLVSDELYTIWQARHRSEDLAALKMAVAAAYTFDELPNEVEDEPELAIALQRQQQYLLDELQEKILGEGVWFKPGFFTEAEIKLSMEKMETKYLSKPWSLSRYIGFIAAVNFFRSVQEAIVEIMSPQRKNEAIEWWGGVGQFCLTTDDKTRQALVPNILATIKSLQTELPPWRNQIVVAMYAISGLKFSQDESNLSPLWIKTFERLGNSIFLKLILRN